MYSEAAQKLTAVSAHLNKTKLEGFMELDTQKCELLKDIECYIRLAL